MFPTEPHCKHRAERPSWHARGALSSKRSRAAGLGPHPFPEHPRSCQISGGDDDTQSATRVVTHCLYFFTNVERYSFMNIKALCAELATHAHPTSPRSTGFCAIWGCIISSSSRGGACPQPEPNATELPSCQVCPWALALALACCLTGPLANPGCELWEGEVNYDHNYGQFGLDCGTVTTTAISVP